MVERGDLLSRLRSVDEILAGARPRAPQEARLLAKLRAADRARQSSSSVLPPWLAFQRAWRPLGVTVGLCAALLALRAGDHAPRSGEAGRSRGSEDGTLALAKAAPRRSPTQSPPSPRAPTIAPRHRAPTIEPHGQREPVSPAPELQEPSAWALPTRPVPWGSELLPRLPRLSSREEPALRSDAFPVERDAATARGAPRVHGLEEPRVLWAEGHEGAAAKAAGSAARRGPSTSPAPPSPRASGCASAESLVDRARADCASQARSLSERGLAYLDACGEGQFRGLDYACAPAAAPPMSPPSAKVPAGCVYETLPPDGVCKTEADTGVEALERCDEAGLALAELTLEQGSCSDGFEGARLLCCEKGAEDTSDTSLPRTKQVCADESDPDCLK